MHYCISIFIGLRYMFGPTTDKFKSFTSNLSTIGITLGVLALIIVTSVMNGFERSLQDSILAYIPQVILTSPDGHIDPKKYPSSSLMNLKDVHQITSIVQSDVVLQSHSNVGIGIMIGVDTNEQSQLLSHLIDKEKNDLVIGQYYVLLGKKLAENLNLKCGDEVRIIIPGVSELTPMGSIPSQRLFTVSGIFKTNSEADSTELIVEKDDAARILRYPQGHITGWHLFLDEPLKVEKLSQQKIPHGLVWTDWRERKGEFFQSVKMEKNMMILLLSLIITVAAFNIITSLSLLVMEKKSEIAILKTLGLKKVQILIIFMFQGAGSGIIGSVTGTLLGVLLSSQLNYLISLLSMLPKGVELPIVLDLHNILIISVFAILTSLLATLYPAWYATTVQPTEVLRYE
ncbi:Lipoprotein-releasing system transmembrane protein LolC [Candidatus Hartigia pinicola]|nr:Lipoprotein-releasing system transmembrane protein LolC [Candidatus Hartigia pinicola]